ncbi:MAG TPA: mechanosensitive ion channel domain-containing protein, partial [Steroidobacter sp.]
MFDFEGVLSLPLFSNSPTAWLIAGSVFVVTLGACLLVRRIIRAYHKRFRSTEATELLEIPVQVLSRTTLLFFIVFAVYLGAQALVMGPRVAGVLASALKIALFWQAGLWAVEASKIWLERKRERSLATDRATAGSLGIIGFIVTVAVWSLVVLLTLDNLGIDITALVAGLGIGGIAVALAVQNILGDLFASLSITLDRPFVVGDFLIVDDFLGSVESIGIKSTRLRSLSGEQIIMPNANLLGSRVRNYGRMYERRVVF